MPHPYVAFGSMHVPIIRNFILLFVAFHCFPATINVLHVIVRLRLIRFVPSPPGYANEPI